MWFLKHTNFGRVSSENGRLTTNNDNQHFFLSNKYPRIELKLSSYCILFYTLKKFSPLTIESNSFWHIFTLFPEKARLHALELNFVRSKWRVKKYFKFDIYNERLEWYKNSTVFAKWAMQSNSNSLGATHKKWKI